MSCLNSGYLHMRHDVIRNLFANALSEVCNDVYIKPEPLPTSTKKLDLILNLKYVAFGNVSRWHCLLSGFSTHSPSRIDTKPSMLVVQVEHGTF